MIKPFFFTSGISLIASPSGQMKISTYHHPPQILYLRENGARDLPSPHTYLSSPEVLCGILPLIDSENVWDITSLGSFEKKEGQSLFWCKHCSAAVKKTCGKISLEFLSQSSFFQFLVQVLEYFQKPRSGWLDLQREKLGAI